MATSRFLLDPEKEATDVIDLELVVGPEEALPPTLGPTDSTDSIM